MAIRYFAIFALTVVIAGCASAEKGPEVQFSEVIREWAVQAEVCRSRLGIRIAALKTTIVPSKGKSRGEDIMILALPIEIANRSQNTVEFTVSHEWYGGNWPWTDLFACVFPSLSSFTWEPLSDLRVGSVFQVGERIGQRRELAKRITTLKPGQSVILNLRMDWPGTGSSWTTPLMDKKVSRTYRVVMLLVFEANGRKQYAESPEMKILVRGMNNTGSEE
jgi:hypothetical protein